MSAEQDAKLTELAAATGTTKVQAMRRLIDASDGVAEQNVEALDIAGVLKLLAVYGHGDVGALDEIDRAFAANVRPLRVISDATQTQAGPNPRSRAKLNQSRPSRMFLLMRGSPCPSRASTRPSPCRGLGTDQSADPQSASWVGYQATVIRSRSRPAFSSRSAIAIA